MGAGWVGFDLDATLAQYTTWQGPESIGEPIPTTVDKVKLLLASGVEVRILTARVSNMASESAKARAAIEKWCLKNIGAILPVTCKKDYGMIGFYDDRCSQVVPNTGVVLRDVLRNLVAAATRSGLYGREMDAAVAALEATV